MGLGLLFFVFVVSYRGFFNGIGSTKIFMYSAVIINVSNVVLNDLLTFGARGFRRMGLTGAGCSSAISMVIGCLFLLYCNFFARVPKNLQELQEVPHTA